MAHDHAAVGQPVEKGRKQRGEIRHPAERRRCRRRPDWCACRTSLARRAEAAAEPVEQQRLAVGRSAASGGTMRPHWRTQAFGAASLTTLEHGLAHLRKQMHVLMAVDEIRRAAEGGGEGLELAARSRSPASRDLSRRSERSAAASSSSGRNAPSRSGCEAAGSAAGTAPVSVTMQADRDARRAGIEDVERDRLGAREARRHHHHRGGVEAPAHDQIADRRVDAGRDAVIVGAQPDATRARRQRSRTSTPELIRRPVRASAPRAASSRAFTRVLGDEIDRPRLLISERILPIYSPTTPIMMSCTPPSTIRPTTSDG